MTEEQKARYEIIGEQLRAKINSKFQTSTFLAGFAFTILGIQISLLWQSTKVPALLFLSTSLMAVAIILYVGAVVRLDKLTMPKPFWKGKENPPEEELIQSSYLEYSHLKGLRNLMNFYWSTLTLVATGFTAISLLSMLLPIRPTDLSDSSNSTEILSTTSLSMAGFSLAAYLYTVLLDRKARNQYGTLAFIKD